MATKDKKSLCKRIIRKLKRGVKKTIRVVFKKKTPIYKNTPIFTVKQICNILKLDVPKKYQEIQNIPVSKTYLFNKLEDKDKIIKDIKYVSISKAPKLDKIKADMKWFLAVYNEQKDSIKDKSLDLIQMMVEWLYVFRPLGYYFYDYFNYEFYNKTKKEASAYLSKRFRWKVYRVANERDLVKVLKDKSSFNEVFKKYVNRKSYNMDKTTYEVFEKFVKKNPRFFAKPVEGTGGYDAGVINVKDYKSLDDLFKYCVENHMIVEEIVKQHPDLAKFNPDSLNTIRVYSLRCADEKVRIMGAIFRTGRIGHTVDNFHSGGYLCLIDVKTGTVVTDAVNMRHEWIKKHPDSKLTYKGFKIPYWDKIVKAIEDAGCFVPGLRHIGWDIAVTDKGEIEFIEGNSMPNFDGIQVPDQIGKLYLYKAYIEELEQLKEKENQEK